MNSRRKPCLNQVPIMGSRKCLDGNALDHRLSWFRSRLCSWRAVGIMPSLEIAFLLFLFHGRVLVVIDEAALALGGSGSHGFLNDLCDRCGSAFHCGG
jgi:hypothetical protein